MNAKDVMKTFDYCWFEREIFEKQPNPCSRSSSTSTIQSDPEGDIRERPENPDFSRAPSTLLRSMSDQLSIQTGFLSSSLSPDTVLYPSPLHAVISEEGETAEEGLGPRNVQFPNKKKGKSSGSKKLRALSKSMSELEFEELKGFMDLGFVFTEEDKDSTLASIIPGLQRLGPKKDDDRSDGVKLDGEGEKTSRGDDADASAIPRPYLSEAWEWREGKKKENALMHWKVPVLGNETDVKDSLRRWAHTVATTIT